VNAAPVELVEDPTCVKAAEVVCSTVTTEVTANCDVVGTTGTVSETTTVDGASTVVAGADTMTVDWIGVVGTGADVAGVDAAGVDGADVEGAGVDAGAESAIVEPAAKVVTATCPLHVSAIGQHLLAPPLTITHCSPGSQ
jgi:hypothetical protein